MSAHSIQHLRLGSLLCEVEATPANYARVIAGVYGTHVLNGADGAAGPVGLTLRIREEPATPRVTDALRVVAVDGGYVLDSDPLHCHLSLDRACPHAELTVTQPAMVADHLAYHFWIVTNRLLLLLDRILLHAAAIDVAGRVDLFCGHKGAGKSSLSVVLGQAGATILAEDHVILRRGDAGFLVSGCTSRMRVTAETETHLLDDGLQAEIVDAGGTPKKQFPAEQFFAARPHEERTPSRLFVTRVGRSLSVRPVSSRETLLHLVDTTASMLRFATREDHASFLDFLAGFVATMPTYALELSPDLSDITRVPGLLDELREQAAR